MKTAGVTLKYTYASGSKGTRNFTGLDVADVSDTDDAADVATNYSAIVDGTLTAAKYTTAEDVEITNG